MPSFFFSGFPQKNISCISLIILRILKMGSKNSNRTWLGEILDKLITRFRTKSCVLFCFSYRLDLEINRFVMEAQLRNLNTNILYSGVMDGPSRTTFIFSKSNLNLTPIQTSIGFVQGPPTVSQKPLSMQGGLIQEACPVLVLLCASMRLEWLGTPSWLTRVIVTLLESVMVSHQLWYWRGDCFCGHAVLGGPILGDCSSVVAGSDARVGASSAGEGGLMGPRDGPGWDQRPFAIRTTSLVFYWKM